MFLDLLIFIGPRYTWGPICGSKCLSVSDLCLVDLTDVSLVDPRKFGNASEKKLSSDKKFSGEKKW